MVTARQFLKISALAAVCGAILASPTFALDKGKDKAPNTTGKSEKLQGQQAISQAALAARLALQGEKRRSPIMMLAAAEILAGLKEGKDNPGYKGDTEKEKDVKTKGDEKKGSPQLSIKYLAKKALEFSKGDAKLTQFIESRLENLSSRGLVYSQGVGLKSITLRGATFKVIDSGVLRPGYRRRVTNVKMEGRRPAMIMVVGDGDGDLDLFVYDSVSGGRIGQDTRSSSIGSVLWTPRYTGPFHVHVVNNGRFSERYVILANW